MLFLFFVYKTIDFPRWKNQINIRRRRDAIQTLKKPLIFWILCSFIIRLLFSSNILAVLVSDKEKVIDSFYKLEQLLINNNDYRILMNSESRTGMIFLLVSLVLYSIN